jgi:hypothetical protein
VNAPGGLKIGGLPMKIKALKMKELLFLSFLIITAF